MSLRYCLAEQIHFPATDPDSPAQGVIVTLQRWRSTTSKSEIYVRVHNGVEYDRRFADTDLLRNRVDESFANARRDFAVELLSDDAAADEVSRRGGPRIQWCTAAGDCGAQIPFAAAQCADGHAVNHVSAGTYVFGQSRRPAFTVITGGKK
jgi:hypothetical protein